MFAAGLIGGLVFYLWVGRGIWFEGDEWDFLTVRRAESLHDLFTSHSQHWSTLPILAYRFWWQVVGLRTYTPYLASVVVLHLIVAVLLRAVMRRSGVSPWVATTVALVFVFFGSGYFNILYGFQIGFCGALAFGLAGLLLVDHDGPLGQRDLIGLGAGLASLMCSGVGVTMVVVMGVAVLIRRGWKASAVVTAPLAATYLLWFAWIGHRGYPPAASVRQSLHFAGVVLSETFSALGHTPAIGLSLAVLLVVGGTVAWQQASADRRRRALAAPLALLVGAVVFAVVTGVGRGAPVVGLGGTPAGSSRYLHVITALLLAAVGVAADALITRWRVAAPLVLVALVVGVPGNIAVAIRHGDQYRAIAAFYRPYILTLPRLPVAAVLPADTLPDRYLDPIMTMGWLREGVAQGRIPPPPSTVTAEDRSTWTLQLALQPTDRRASSCSNVQLPTTVTVHPGDTLTSGRGTTATLLMPSGVMSQPRLLGYPPGSIVVAYATLALDMTSGGASPTVTVCRHPS